MPVDHGRRDGLLAGFAGKRLLAVGDLMLDEFIWGTVSRISPEAPVPVVNVTGESYYPGGAANVARNLCEFTASVRVMGLAGEDAGGCRLLELLENSGIDTGGVQRDARYPTTLKTRIIARNQQVVRVDRERKTSLDEGQLARARARAEEIIPEVDAVVAADYGKGFLSQALAGHICRVARDCGKILAVDPHPHTSLVWPGATAMKPNRAEAFLAAGVPWTDPVSPPLADEALLGVGNRLLRDWGCGMLLITLGEQGMMLMREGEPPYHTPARARDVFDVSGAGDTAIAVLAMALAAGAPPREAAEMANCASGVAVGKLGTATVSLAELRAAVAAL
jgi:D-beta-D-heptose 7-phosphate kinase/D-beta-D-heptose 1-phosphate adenosyltransferase